jgi:hypothetical protein
MKTQLKSTISLAIFSITVLLFTHKADATLRFSPASGDWNVAENWYDDEDGNIKRLPREGDFCYVGPGQVCIVPEGCNISDLSISIGRRDMGVGTLITKPGCKISRCAIEVAQVAGTVTATDKNALLQIDGGDFEKINLKFLSYGKILQNAGNFSCTNQFNVPNNSTYEFNAGTNNSQKIYVSSSAPTNHPSIVANKDAVFGSDCSSFVMCGGGNYFTGCKFLNTSIPIVVAQNSKDNVYAKFFNFTNKLNTIQIAVTGHNRNSYTGTVDIVNSDITCSQCLQLAGQTSSYAVLNIYDSKLWLPKFDDGSSCADENPNIRKINIFGDSFITIGDNGNSTWYERDDDAFFSSASRNWHIPAGGEVSIYGGLVRVSDRLFLFPNATLNIYGGEVRVKRIFTKVGLNGDKEYAKPFNLNVYNDGKLKVIGDCSIGGDLNSNVMSPCEVVVSLNGGLVEASSIKLATRSTNQIQRLIFNGGTCAQNTSLNVQKDRLVSITQKGSVSPDIAGFLFSGEVQDFIMEFVLDKSPNHLMPIRMWNDRGYACRTGHLRVRLDGGVMVSSRDTFDIMTIPESQNATFLKFANSLGNMDNIQTHDFLSVPDTSLWKTNLSENARTVSISLAEPLAAVSWRGTSVDFSAAPKAMGNISLSNISTNNCLQWEVKMHLVDTDGNNLSDTKLDEILNGFIKAGYVNSEIITEDGANIKLVVSPEDMPLGNARFVWDMTDSSFVKTPELTVTNALVKSIAFRNEPIVKGFLFLVK